ncbi:hypothetical protein [Nocardia tengchongensis]|uniref:hypothetical protein n=1 Tax=Nocardia tengchongensis TaxID=2055889 RepID=UPI003662A025
MAATAVDFDPEKSGGWASLPTEAALCGPHAAAIGAGADWICHSPEGVSGWEVLVGEQIKSLNKYAFRSAPLTIRSDSAQDRDSGVIPGGRKVSFDVRQIGSKDPSTTVDLYLNAAQAREMIELLEFFIEFEERR